MKRIVILLAISSLTLAFCEDVAVAPIVATPAVDHVATIVGYLWAGMTALGVLLTAIAAALRLFKPDSTTATVVDAVGHAASAIGTSVKPSQYVVPKQ